MKNKLPPNWPDQLPDSITILIDEIELIGSAAALREYALRLSELFCGPQSQSRAFIESVRACARAGDHLGIERLYESMVPAWRCAVGIGPKLRHDIYVSFQSARNNPNEAAIYSTCYALRSRYQDVLLRCEQVARGVIEDAKAGNLYRTQLNQTEGNP